MTYEQQIVRATISRCCINLKCTCQSSSEMHIFLTKQNKIYSARYSLINILSQLFIQFNYCYIYLASPEFESQSICVNGWVMARKYVFAKVFLTECRSIPHDKIILKPVPYSVKNTKSKTFLKHSLKIMISAHGSVGNFMIQPCSEYNASRKSTQRRKHNTQLVTKLKKGTKHGALCSIDIGVVQYYLLKRLYNIDQYTNNECL